MQPKFKRGDIVRVEVPGLPNSEWRGIGIVRGVQGGSVFLDWLHPSKRRWDHSEFGGSDCFVPPEWLEVICSVGDGDAETR
jgi:hypothetical protein